MSHKKTTPMVTPPVLAKRWGVKPAKIVAWIRSGELKAIDLSTTHGTGRPRYRISEADIAAFEARRASQKWPKPSRQRRRNPSNPTDYF